MSEPSLSASGVISEAVRLLASSLNEVVPPEAQLHLINAQRELLLAIAVIIEHNSSRTPRHPRRRGPAQVTTASRRPKRVELD